MNINFTIYTLYFQNKRYLLTVFCFPGNDSYKKNKESLSPEYPMLSSGIAETDPDTAVSSKIQLASSQTIGEHILHNRKYKSAVRLHQFL